MTPPLPPTRKLRVGMVGFGMIFAETYLPVFEQLFEQELFKPEFGRADVSLAAVATRTGKRVETFQRDYTSLVLNFASYHGPTAVDQLLKHGVDAVCIATPDDRHFAAAKAALSAGKHVLIEKPSVLRLQELDELVALARQKGALAKVVYHKLLDPDHKNLRTYVADGVLKHVNNGYCSLLEPKQISGSQFAEWIAGRNPGTYVAVHYVKLIDFTFFEGTGAKLRSMSATGQRGLVGKADGPTWDSVQLRLTYAYPDGREATFDIHTSWVNPDNYPGYVEQEVQFRFDNGVWNASQRQRGVEVTVEGRSPHEIKTTPNNHYNATFLEPWGERTHRGYGLETIRRFFEEVAFVECAPSPAEKRERLEAMRALSYNDLSAERNTIAAVQALEAILERHAKGEPDCVAYVNSPKGGLVLRSPGRAECDVLYKPNV